MDDAAIFICPEDPLRYTHIAKCKLFLINDICGKVMSDIGCMDVTVNGIMR